jgi:nitrogen fixation NifU-like protein
VEDMRFSGPGCAISRASGSILTEFIKGKEISKIRKMTEEEFLGMVGVELTPVRKKCALLSLRVLKKGFENLK